MNQVSINKQHTHPASMFRFFPLPLIDLTRIESFRALTLSNEESLRAQKLSFRVLEFTVVVTITWSFVKNIIILFCKHGNLVHLVFLFYLWLSIVIKLRIIIQGPKHLTSITNSCPWFRLTKADPNCLLILRPTWTPQGSWYTSQTHQLHHLHQSRFV